MSAQRQGGELWASSSRLAGMRPFAANESTYGSALGPIRASLVKRERINEAGGLDMRRSLGSNWRTGRRNVGLAGAAVLVAGLAAGPGILTARSATPVGSIERVSVGDGRAGAERDARSDAG